MKQDMKKAGLGATAKAVFWSFFGIRKQRDYDSDAANLNPVYVIIAAVIGVAIFIGILLTIIHFVVAK
jgi:preprotein translocase subunit Sec61beta